ncbi:hypothetical protein [Caldimonas sp. KR1-144]|uniref:hypothetical protein n=1 Tax=Caldimonas sp. KR1-144 TaxID=3400911 RepID=UPI003C0348F2
MITDDLYTAIRRELKKAKDPKTCNDIFDTAAIRQMEDVDTEDVSNALAALWRRGFLERFAVNRAHGRGPRYGYKLRAPNEEIPAFKPAPHAVNVDNLNVEAQDDGSVVISTDKLVITVKAAGVSRAHSS